MLIRKVTDTKASGAVEVIRPAHKLWNLALYTLHKPTALLKLAGESGFNSRGKVGLFNSLQAPFS
jgi:hypothetical protein